MGNKKEFRTDIVMGGRVNPSVKRSSNTVCKYLKTISSTMLATAGIASIGMAFNTIKNKALESVEAGKQQVEAETKLRAILQNVVSLQKQGPTAYIAATKALSNQAGQLQKIGVIGDEVTLAGMQQLATFQLSDKEISNLSGSMTDLIAQQKGLNATQQDAVTIANLIGKAMMGNVGSLSRVGITFTKAQANALKMGNSIERSKILTQILQQNVGGVNKALAQTPMGQIQQANNLWSDMQENIGIKLMPIMAKFAEASLVALPIVENGVYAVINACTSLYHGFESVVNFAQNNATPIFVGLGAIIGGLVAYKTIQGLQMLQVQMALASKEAGIMGMVANGNLVGALKAMAVATWNSVRAFAAQAAALLANPITWVVLGVAALTAGLVALALNWDKVTAAVGRAVGAVKNFFKAKGDNNTPAISVAPKAKPIKGHKALGTNSFVGGATWMNEAGHEGAILPRGTKILSNNKMNNLENSSGITMNVPINITIEGNADKNIMEKAVNSTMPSIKQQIDAYFRQKQRLGVAFA